MHLPISCYIIFGLSLSLNEADANKHVILRADSREVAKGVLNGLRLPLAKLSQRRAPASVRRRCDTVDG